MAVSAVDLFGRLLLDPGTFRDDAKKEAAAAGDAVGQTLGSKVNSGLRQSLTSGLSSPSGILAKITGQGGLLQRGFSAAGGAVGKFGDGLGHAKNRLVGLLTGPLGMLGLGGGLLSLAGLFKAGIDKARDFGGEVNRLRAVAGLTVPDASRLAAILDHFGISADTAATLVGRLELNLGKLTASSSKGAASSDKLARAQEGVRKAEERLHVARLRLSELERKGGASASTLAAARNRVADATRALSTAEAKLNGLHGKLGVSSTKAAELERKYGLTLTDSKGKVLGLNQVILELADFWNNKAIPPEQKAVVLNQLLGKTWQDLIPVLGAGRAGIQGAAEEAEHLGLSLTKDNLDALAKLKIATRSWTDALGGLKLQVGLAVIPVLTDLTNGLKTLVVDNRVRIVNFIRSIVETGERLARVFGTTVLPIIQNVISILATAGSGGGALTFSTVLADSADFARDLSSVLNSFVVPAVKAVVGAWNGLPPDLRELLIKGFIANKVIKWTFGFDAIGFGKQLAGEFIKNTVGRLTATIAGESVVGALEKAGIGKAFVQPVFVTNPGFAAGGAANAAEDAATAAAGGKGGGIKAFLSRLFTKGGLLAALGLAGGEALAHSTDNAAVQVAGFGVSIASAAKLFGRWGAALVAAQFALEKFGELTQLNDDIAQQTRDLQTEVHDSFKSVPTEDLTNELNASIDALNEFHKTTDSLGPAQELLYGSQKKALEDNITAIQKEMEARKNGTTTFEGFTAEERSREAAQKAAMAAAGVGNLAGTGGPAATPDEIGAGVARHVAPELDQLHRDLQANLHTLEKSNDPAKIAAAAKRIAAEVEQGAGSVKGTQRILASLRHQLSQTHDPRLQAVLRGAIARVEAKLPNRVFVERQLAEAKRIAASTLPLAKKSDALHAIIARLRASGNTHAASIVSHILGTTRAVNNAKSAIVGAVGNVKLAMGGLSAQVVRAVEASGGKVKSAAGGPASAFEAHLVGETREHPQGELFVPRVPGVVLPNWLLRSLAGAGAPSETNITTVNVPVDGLVRAETPGDIARVLRQVGNTGYLPPRRRLTTFSSRRKLALGDV